VPQVSPEALKSYVAGSISAANALQLEYQSMHDRAPAQADQAIASLNRAIELHRDYASAYAMRGDA